MTSWLQFEIAYTATLGRCHGVGRAKMTNALQVIKPYWVEGTWVFDDPEKELVREPFVSSPERIDALVEDIPGVRDGFRLTFSAESFPGCQRELSYVREAFGRHGYRAEDLPMEAALYKYFEGAPEMLYMRADEAG